MNIFFGQGFIRKLLYIYSKIILLFFEKYVIIKSEVIMKNIH